MTVCRSYAMSTMSVCLSVTLVDCDQIMQEKVEMAHDISSVCRLLHAKANPDRSSQIVNYTKEDYRAVEKMWSIALQQNQWLICRSILASAEFCSFLFLTVNL